MARPIEGFFSLVKRAIYGIYHQVSKKHLQRYLDECSLRYNHRDDENGAGFLTVLTQCKGRLTYKRLIAHDAA